MNNQKKPSVTIIYDGECPFCKSYVRFVSLKETTNDLLLVDARENNNQTVKDVLKKGYNLDKGMVAIIDDKYFHGADAVHALSLLSTSSGIFNKFNYWVFRSQGRSKFFYPLLKMGRNTALFIKGEKQLGY